MKPFLFSLISLLLLSACSSSHYRLTLRDGRELNSIGEPELNRKTGYYKFYTLEKKDSLIRAEEVLQITEL